MASNVRLIVRSSSEYNTEHREGRPNDTESRVPFKKRRDVCPPGDGRHHAQQQYQGHEYQPTSVLRVSSQQAPENCCGSATDEQEYSRQSKRPPN